MQICIVASTRPNIIKQYGLIRQCIDQKINYYVLHTWQHYSENMSGNFFGELGLPTPDINLWVSESNRVDRMIEIQSKLNNMRWSGAKPSIVIVQWDTDSDIIVAITAKMMGIKVAHNEAGIRSNSDIPEEYNRRIIDQISDYLFVPTERDYERVITEWLKGQIYLTGNTTCDCIMDQKYILPNNKYIFMTLHRDSNVDDKEVFEKILSDLVKFQNATKIPIIFSVHPRTIKMINLFWLNRLTDMFVLKEPLSYSDTIRHISWAEFIITDSGGIQEECCILKKKCVIMRDSTERAYIGSVLRKWDLFKAIAKLNKIDSSKIKNIFNPMKYKSISKKILSIILANGLS